MSGKNDPFGREGKTVIAPSPGAASRRDFRDAALPAPGLQASARPPVTGTILSPAFPIANPETGVRQPEQAAPRFALDVALNAANGVKFPSSNPLVSAAAPLLILLGRLRLHSTEIQVAPMMNQLLRLVTEFEHKATDAGVAQDEASVAKYVLCGTADEIVQNLPGVDRDAWTLHSLLVKFFQVRSASVGFFEELDKALADPAQRYDLLELMHTCLQLGFQGQYRGTPGGSALLQRVAGNLHLRMRQIKTLPDDEISPRWRGMALRRASNAPRVPLWAIASFAGAILVGAFFLLRFLIGNEADALETRLAGLSPTTTIKIERVEPVAYTPPPPQESTQLQRVRTALADEIAAGTMTVGPSGDQIVVSVSNAVLFASGKVDARKEFEPIGKKIAETLDKEPGPISVIGHTDNVKPKVSSRYKSNHDLSLARAASVQAVLAKSLSDAARLKVDGKGDLEPIADNGTQEGRAANRRVEIMIPKEETLQ
ncbi:MULTISPECIES: type VI secretion system protein TssL, long form [unclassified Mesorhizobium]|uniref:type VI secretion system protein TssL, long form n=1 Tax=unclassified Mesorhizobium TaxID=325217 RepID=UPI0030154DF6